MAYGRDLSQGERPMGVVYRAVDKEGKTIDFLLSEKRDEPAARAFFEKGIDSNGLPDKVTMVKVVLIKLE